MRKLNKGFTIVELIIVIAVIAVLASVLIPTFINVYNNAQISADTQNAAGANSLIFAESALGEEPDDIEDVNNILQSGGLGFSSLTTQNQNAIFAWDNTSKQIVYLDNNFNLIYSSKQYDPQVAELWLPVESIIELDGLTQKVNCYLTKDYSVENFQLDFGLIVAEGATFTGNITVKSDANIALGGNIIGDIYVSDGATVKAKNALNLYHSLTVEQTTGGTLTHTYAATNGQIENNFAKVGEQINVDILADDGYMFNGFEVDGLNIEKQNDVWSFTMPQSSVTLKANFVKITARPEVTTNGITYTLKFDGAEPYYEVTAALADQIATQNGVLILEEIIDEILVKAIANSALKNKGLTHVIVPESITKIGSSAFANNVGLKTVVFLADSIYFVEGDVVDFEIYPFFGCFSDGEDYQNPQLTVYYTATTNNTSNWLNYASLDDSVEDKVIFYKANSVTENWEWQDNTLTVDGTIVLPESTDSQPDDGTDDNTPEGGDDNSGDNNDDSNTDDGSNDNNDENTTTPETPQTFTITIVMNFDLESTRKVTIGADNKDKSVAAHTSYKISVDNSSKLKVEFTKQNTIRIYIDDQMYECYTKTGSPGAKQNASIIRITNDNDISTELTTANEVFGEINLTSDITITINY